MKQIIVYNQKGEKVGKMTLDPKVFDVEENDDLISRAAIFSLANKRTISAKTKTRAEVRGGGRKPWKQKGTGRARAGTIRSPLWRGGGVTFGPTGKENYQKNLSPRIRKNAILSALSNKARAEEIIVLDKIDFKNIKTKQVEEMLNKLPTKEGTFLYIYDKLNPKTYFSMRNLPYLKCLSTNSLNILDILEYKWLLLEKETIKKLSIKK